MVSKICVGIIFCGLSKNYKYNFIDCEFVADDPINTCNKKLHFLISWINSTRKSLKIDEYWWNNNETTIKILFTHHPCAIALGTCFRWGPWFCFPAVTFRTFVNYVHLHRFVYPSSCFLKSQIQVKLKPWRINNLAKF